MVQMHAKGIVALAMSCCAWFGVAHAADPMPAKTRLISASNAPVTAPVQPVTFTIATAQDLVVTLTDLQVPSPLVSAGVVVTQAGTIAGSALLAAPATTATASIAAAVGDYTLYVFGVPNANFSVGTFSVCVAPKASPSNCIQGASLSGSITAQSTAKDPTVSTLSTSLTVTTAGSYTFTFADLQFPVLLKTPPNVALFQGSTPIIPPGQTTPAIASGSSLTLNPGTYQLLGIAQADQTVKSGLYGITITGPAGTSPLLDTTVPVGLTNTSSSVQNPSAQSLTLKVTDYGFPGPLASASALLTAGGRVVGTANAAGGAATFAAPAGLLTLWIYGSAGATAGTYSADVAAGTTDLYTAAQGVGPSGTTYAYAFVSPVLTAGAYQAAAADLQFPSSLTGLSFAVAQNGVILQQSATAGLKNFNAAAGTAVLLVSAQTSSNGLFDVNVQSTGATPQLVYDKTQSVSSTAQLFDSQSLTLGVNGSFDAYLNDLKFPAKFDSLALVISRGAQVLGTVYGGGKLPSFPGTPGTYQLTFLATPSAQQQFGLYSASIVYSPPAVTLTSNVSTAAVGATVQLSWTATNATTCSASGGAWSGSKATSTSTSTEAVVLSATTTYTLSCTGSGGSTSQSVTVTATQAPAKSGGGGALDLSLLGLCGALLAARSRRSP